MLPPNHHQTIPIRKGVGSHSKNQLRCSLCSRVAHSPTPFVSWNAERTGGRWVNTDTRGHLMLRDRKSRIHSNWGLFLWIMNCRTFITFWEPVHNLRHCKSSLSDAYVKLVASFFVFNDMLLRWMITFIQITRRGNWTDDLKRKVLKPVKSRLYQSIYPLKDTWLCSIECWSSFYSYLHKRVGSFYADSCNTPLFL